MKHRIILAALVTCALLFMFSAPISSDALLQIDGPEPRGMHGMVFDSHNEVVVIFGGTTLEGGIHSLGDTWMYDYAANTWTEIVSTPSPPARSNLAMVYCNETEEIILFSGQGIADTWSFDVQSQTWSEVSSSTNPGIHHSHGMAYDPRENVVILFGGFGADGMERNDTWKFDCDTREWTELFPETAPLARYGHVMVYDESINQIVLTNGNTAYQGHQDDTWTYNVVTNTWTEIITTGSPWALKWPSMTYDSVSQKCILFGGQIGDTAIDHTLSYDAQSTTWSNLYPTESPPARICSGFAFDSVNEVSILFGGWLVEGGQLGDAWAYTFDTNTWVMIEDSTVITSTSTTTSTPTTTSTSTTTDPPPDLTLAYVAGAGIIIAAIVIVILVNRR
ncbi:MAG: Kelch repeat-containing protein [Promethearchaeota archaeon]